MTHDDFYDEAMELEDAWNPSSEELDAYLDALYEESMKAMAYADPHCGPYV